MIFWTHLMPYFRKKVLRGDQMKFWSKFICLLFVCLTLSSCNLDDFLYYSIKPNSENIKVDDENVFLDKTYTEYVGGQDAKTFFDKYVCADQYKDLAFHYYYADHVAASSIGVILNPSIFVVDVYYDSYDFSVVTFAILPHTNMSGEMPSQIIREGFWCVTRVIDDNLNQDNLCSVMFDEEHNTIRYVFIYGFYSENFLADDAPFSPGVDDSEIRDVTRVLLPQLKWNTKWPGYPDDHSDWIFDYSSKNNVETTETNAEESTEESS